MPTNLDSSRKFWDQKAQQNPYWYISSYGPYEGRDLEEFWRSGLNIWQEIKATIDYWPSPSHTVVEIGCGVGRLTRAIAPEVKEVFSFDISEQMLQLARQNVPSNVKLNLAEGTSLSSIPNACVDLALAYCVFQHLPTLKDFESYLRAMHRVTKPGGIIAFTICERHWTWSLFPLLRLKGFVKSKLHLQPPDLYKKEWLGVRPSMVQIRNICPVNLEVKYIGGGRTLLWGRV